MLSKALNIFALCFFGFHTLCFSLSTYSSYDCATEIDFQWEGNWASDLWFWYNGAYPQYYKSAFPGTNSEIRPVSWELGDIHYRRISGGGSLGEWHAEILDAITISNNTPVVIGYPSVGCVDANLPSDCLGDATKKKVYTLSPISFYLSTPDLYRSIESSQKSFSDVWGDGNLYYKGYRTPSSPQMSVSGRRSVISTASSIANHTIDYTWADMLENKWSGFSQDWDGSVGDIDEIRCDGVVEYAFEKNGFRVWGTDDNWNIANGSNHNLNQHNELWEHDDFDLGELSPVIQSGCGGYGQGQRTTLRQRSFTSPPEINGLNIYLNSSNPNQYIFTASKIKDLESEKVFVSVQVNYNGNWYFVADNYGNWWHNKSWASSSPMTFVAVSTEEYTLNQGKLRWRVIAIDQGLNASIQEFDTDRYLANTGSYKEIDFIAQFDGIYKYDLQVPQGSDFDIVVNDMSRSGFQVAAGYNGTSLSEHVEFFAQAGSNFRIRIYSYLGSGTYSLSHLVPQKAYRYNMNTIYGFSSSLGEHTISNLPSSGGWAIVWGDFASNDIDMQILDNGIPIQSSTSTRPHEVIIGNYQGKSLRIYRHLGVGSTGSLLNIYKLE